MVNYPPLIPTIDASNNINVSLPAGYLFSYFRWTSWDGYRYIYNNITTNNILNCNLSCYNNRTNLSKQITFLLSDIYTININDFLKQTFDISYYLLGFVTIKITYSEVDNDNDNEKYYNEESRELYTRQYTTPYPNQDCTQIINELVLKSIQKPYPDFEVNFDKLTQKITIIRPSDYIFNFYYSTFGSNIYKKNLTDYNIKYTIVYSTETTTNTYFFDVPFEYRAEIIGYGGFTGENGHFEIPLKNLNIDLNNPDLVTNITLRYSELNHYDTKNPYDLSTDSDFFLTKSGSPPDTNCPDIADYINIAKFNNSIKLKSTYPPFTVDFNKLTQKINVIRPNNYVFNGYYAVNRNISNIPSIVSNDDANITYTIECLTKGKPTTTKNYTNIQISQINLDTLKTDLNIDYTNTYLVTIKLKYSETTDNGVILTKSGSPQDTICTDITDYINITKFNNSINLKSTYPFFTVNFDKLTQQITVIRPDTYVFNGYYKAVANTLTYEKVENNDDNITYTIECLTTTGSVTTYTYQNKPKSFVIDLNTLNIDYTNTYLVTIKLKYSETQGNGFVLTKLGSPQDTNCTDITNFIKCKKKASQLNNLPFLALYNIMNKESETNRKNGSTYNTLNDFIDSTTNTTITDVQIPTNTYFSLNTITENVGDIILHEDGLIKVIQDKDNKIMVLSKINCHRHIR